MKQGLEFEIEILKRSIKIGRRFLELLESSNNKKEVFEVLFDEIMKEKDPLTAFVFGILYAETEKLEIEKQFTGQIQLPYPSTFCTAVLNNFIKALLMLKEGYKEEEIIRDYIRSYKNFQIEKQKTYG